MNGSAVAFGLALTLIVHGALVAFLILVPSTPASEVLVMRRPPSSIGYGLCGKRRCTLPEWRERRRGIEPTPVSQEILQASLYPALGYAKPKPHKMPELQTYEQPKVEDVSVNLKNENPKPREKIKMAAKRRKAKRDKHRRRHNRLADIFKNFHDDDPRKRATALDKIIGSKSGIIGGQGHRVQAGNVYARKITPALRRAFTVPPFLTTDQLAALRVRVLVTQMSPSGEIIAYKITSKSGNKAFDDAAIAAIRTFVPSEGGSDTLSAPDPDVLRYINARGLSIDLDGRFFTP